MSRRTIYTSADKKLSYWLRTKPYLEAYAKRVGARLIVLPKSERKNPQWALFDAFALSLEREGDYVWMDSDIIMGEDAPDLFSLEGKFFVTAPDPPQRVHPRWRRVYKKHGVPNCRPYPVTAIVKWQRRHVGAVLEWVEKNPLPRGWGDQEVLALACYHTETCYAYFPQSWHSMTRWVTKSTKFFHAAGGRKRRKITGFIKRVEGEKEGDAP